MEIFTSTETIVRVIQDTREENRVRRVIQDTEEGYKVRRGVQDTGKGYREWMWIQETGVRYKVRRDTELGGEYRIQSWEWDT